MSSRDLRWRVVLAIALAAMPSPVAAQAIPDQALAHLRSLAAEKASRTPVQRRIDSNLLAALRLQQGQKVAEGVASVEAAVRASVAPAPDGKVEVDLRAEMTSRLLSGLRGLGAELVSAHPKYRTLRARVPLAAIEQVASLPGVRFVARPAPAVTNAGLVTSQGDGAHRAPDLRALGLSGAGVRIGVLSDGVDSLAASIAAGELPADVTVLSGQEGIGDEGTAMLEIIHDLAPGAQLYFATAFDGVASFAANIEALRAAGCDIIVDDVTYLDEGAFQDGPIARAVNAVSADGALFFSSAANSGNLTSGTSGTWEGDFSHSGLSIPAIDDFLGEPAGRIHAFAPGVAANTVTLATRFVSLKWSDPLEASSNDYDLYVLDSTLTNVIAFSANFQAGFEDPYEGVDLGAGVLPDGARIVVAQWVDPDPAAPPSQPRALRLDLHGGRLAVATAGSTFGHNGGESTLSVAAAQAPFGGAAFVGGTANPIQIYSSDGPRRIFYEPDGGPITPGNVLFATNGGRVLQKPDFTAADCVSTSVSGFASFCGTSAAAPHAGAIAALLLSAPADPTPALAAAALRAGALDIMAAGVDRDAGHGILMAPLAAAVADLAVDISGPDTVAVGSDVTYAITVTNHGIGEASGIELTLPLPKGLAFVSNAGDCATAFPCALGPLAAGASAVVTATYSVPVLYGGSNPIRPQPAVASTSVDPVGANDTATTATAVTGATLADLEVTSTAPVFAQRGAPLLVQTTVTNHGPADAVDVVADLTVPAGTTFVSHLGDCAAATPPCVLGTLPNAASRTFTTSLAIPVDYPAPTPIVTTATAASAATPDPDSANDTSVATIRFGAFFAVTPCRVADTRNPASPNGPPALAADSSRTFTLAGLCGVPAGATAVALNVSAVDPQALGHFRLFPADEAMPGAAVVNFGPGVTRANNAIVRASADGQVSLTVFNRSTGSTHAVVDVTGYFQ